MTKQSKQWEMSRVANWNNYEVWTLYIGFLNGLEPFNAVTHIIIISVMFLFQ